jgi:oligopeptide transport system substrate-binding protein
MRGVDNTVYKASACGFVREQRLSKLVVPKHYHMKKIFLPTLWLAGTFSLLLHNSCGSGTAEHSDKSIFKLNELGAVTSLDPAMAGSFENNWVLNQLYNGLVEMDADLKVQPSIAKYWTISDNGMEYTFYLRNDVVFHDNPQFSGGKGRVVTASDLVYSFDRLFDRRISNASTLLDVVDHDPVAGNTGFSAINDSVFTIKLKRPFKPFLGILTMKYFSVVAKEVVQFYGDDYYNHPVGTGPFQLKFWKSNTSLVLEKNPNYFKMDESGNRLPYLDAVAISFIRDPESAFMQFMAGDLDMVSGIDAINKEKVLERDGSLKTELQNKIVLQSEPFLKTDYLGIVVDPTNDLVKSSPLSNKYLRQAINFAIDRDKIVRFRRYNLGTGANRGFIPPDMHAYDHAKLRGFTYNPDKAKELLDMAGFPGGKGLTPIRLTTTSTYMDIAEEVRHQLQEVGIPVEIEILQPTAFKTAVADNKVLFFRKSWIGDYPDPENFMSIFYSKNFSPKGSNYMHFKHTEFDLLYERSLIEQNDSVRSELFLRMDQILVDESPVVPLYYDRIVRLVQKNVSGLIVDPTNMINLERVKK